MAISKVFTNSKAFLFVNRDFHYVFGSGTRKKGEETYAHGYETFELNAWGIVIR